MHSQALWRVILEHRAAAYSCASDLASEEPWICRYMGLASADREELAAPRAAFEAHAGRLMQACAGLPRRLPTAAVYTCVQIVVTRWTRGITSTVWVHSLRSSTTRLMFSVVSGQQFSGPIAALSFAIHRSIGFVCTAGAPACAFGRRGRPHRRSVPARSPAAAAEGTAALRTARWRRTRPEVRRCCRRHPR